MKTRGMSRANHPPLKSGFYIEIFEEGVKKGIKIRSETQKEMEESASNYGKFKRVVILGEYRNGEPFTTVANG